MLTAQSTEAWMVKPVLVFGYGNPSRGDDALGSELLKRLITNPNINWNQVECLSDYQLQIEHALDLEERRLVLFVDAAVNNHSPFSVQRIKPARDPSFTTHAMTPAAVLQVYQSTIKQVPPPCFLLKIKAERFELGEGLSRNARQNLQCAYEWVIELLKHSSLSEWQKLMNNARNIAA